MTDQYGPRTIAADSLHAMKYRGQGEDFREAMNRVAFGLKDSDKHYHELRQILLHQRFCPGGRIQGAIGASKEVTAYNCFVSGKIADSFVSGPGSIMDRAKEAASTMRMGGGIGYDFSVLRPRGDLIAKLQSQSSGPVSFMHIFDAVCLATSSSGHRRGAQMGVLRVDHPDVEEFVRAKQNSNLLAGFNISLAITDEFMEAVQEEKEFELRFNNRVYKTVNAAELWEKIMRSTWDYAEPGAIFIDTINKQNNLWYCETIDATNPCFTADTLVYTPYGTKSFGDLIATQIKSIPVLTQLESGKLAFRNMINPRLTQNKQKLVRLYLRGSGRKSGEITTLRCTPNHKFFLTDGAVVEAQNLQQGQSIYSFYRHKANSKGYIKLEGFSDNVLEHVASAEYRYGYRPYYPEEHAHHVDNNKANNAPENIEILSAKEHNAANMREKNAAGIMSHNTYTGNPGKANGRWRDEIATEYLQELRNSGLSYAAIADKIGASKYMVMQRLGWTRNHVVERVEILDYVEDVYCGTVEETGKFFVALGDGKEGILVSNCGEQPLPPFGACLLGSFNLVKYLIHSSAASIDEPQYAFDYEQLLDDIPHIVRGLDNVIDRTRYPLAEQKAEAISKRRMGIGVMGLANAIEACGFAYGTSDFIMMQEKILSRIEYHCYEASVELAQEKGPFPLFDAERYLQGKHIKQLPRTLQEKIRLYGIRNSHLTSIAPTGTISMCADNVSGGIEPVFAYSVQRQINSPGGPIIANVEDYGAAFLGVKGKLAAEVTALEHIAVLTAAQKYVDSAVSKTVNMTSSMPWGEFKDLYRLAWENGCKGCATFNSDGKRGALLVATDESANETEAVSCLVPDPLTGQRECG